METAGVAVDAGNHSYVLHRGPHPIMEFTADGSLVRSWGDGLFVRPHSIRVDAEGNIWTTDDGAHTVLKMDRQGRIVLVLGRYRNSSESQGMTGPQVGGALRGMRDETVVRFNGPTDSAVAPNGDIFVADGYGNSRVVKFNKEGIFVKEWGKRGSAPGEFNTPHSIVVDKQNRVLVADRENYRVQIFDTDGVFQEEWKDLGSPWGLALTVRQSYSDCGWLQQPHPQADQRRQNSGNARLLWHAAGPVSLLPSDCGGAGWVDLYRRGPQLAAAEIHKLGIAAII
jgi:DNA-binding beta-propeller fold protein YncE